MPKGFLNLAPLGPKRLILMLLRRDLGLVDFFLFEVRDARNLEGDRRGAKVPNLGFQIRPPKRDSILRKSEQ